AMSPDSQQQFLANTLTAISTVQTRGELTILGSVSFDVRIQQKQIATAYFDPPDLGPNAAGPREYCDVNRRSILSDCRFHRQVIDVRWQILFMLPPVFVQALAE